VIPAKRIEDVNRHAIEVDLVVRIAFTLELEQVDHEVE
jgi:hypothetical protein